MKSIIYNAENSQENKISSTISINRNDVNWSQDENEKNYVSKVYSVTAGANIGDYTIKISMKDGQDLGGIKITDLNNSEKQTFSPKEQFKILVPIKNMTNKREFDIKVEAQVKTKPVLYGVAPNSGYQDYALTMGIYEDGTGMISDEYNKNETKIIVIKEDEETKQRLEGVEFELLDENKQTVYASLKTDKEGKITINNLIPGKYYLKETNTLDGYEKYEDLVELDLEFNQEFTVTVNNKKGNKPTVETSEKKLSVTETKKKLPLTGK